jgi:hypothetical protein
MTADLFAAKDILPRLVEHQHRRWVTGHPETIRAIIEGRRKGGIRFCSSGRSQSHRFAHAYHMPQEICIEA